MRYFPQSLRWQASFIFTSNLARLNVSSKIQKRTLSDLVDRDRNFRQWTFSRSQAWNIDIPPSCQLPSLVAIHMTKKNDSSSVACWRSLYDWLAL
ncbi:hypothetical protein FOCG_18574 [Fusarium oxysporum f. sp. radicis-lycopersici 26381]|nr:hypothetical protein FOCG_18574 [Fusarium oxysporum f. sp. radicis-lycopersici 26381]